MSVTINRSGGGGGFNSTDALVRLVADYGSSVSVTAGGTTKTLKSLPIIGASGKSCYYDIVKPGAFSATARSYAATLGSDSASESIVVNAAGEYTGDLIFWNGELYQAGNWYRKYTGGWEAKGVRFSSTIPGTTYGVSGSAPTLSPEGEDMTISIKSSGTDNISGSVLTKSKVDLTGFSSLTLTAYKEDISGAGASPIVFYVTETDTASGSTIDTLVTSGPVYNNGQKEITLDISGVNESVYVGVNVASFSGANVVLDVDSIILS